MAKKKTNGEKEKDVKLFAQDVVGVREKLEAGEPLLPDELTTVLRKTADDLRAYTMEKDSRSPIDYIANHIGVTKSALNSYFFTTFGVFQKDLDEKVHQYVAFTGAIIHALNLGFYLGRGGDVDGQPTADTGKGKSKPGKTRANSNGTKPGKGKTKASG